jgi:hypothetical protein
VKILVYGSHKFDDYNTFMRGIVVAIDSQINDATKTVELLTAGPYKVNSFTAEFCNKTQQYFKQKKIKIKFSKVAYNDIMSNFEKHDINEVLLFANKDDIIMSWDSLIHKADGFGVKTAIYKY